jgi:hypothetical protein
LTQGGAELLIVAKGAYVSKMNRVNHQSFIVLRVMATEDQFRLLPSVASFRHRPPPTPARVIFFFYYWVMMCVGTLLVGHI